MADDRSLGRIAQQSGQPRDELGRYAHITRGLAGYKYDPERRQLYRLWEPGEPAQLRPGWHARVDRGALYVPAVPPGLGAIPPVTPRGFTLGLAAIADAALSYACATWLDSHGATSTLSLDRIGLAITLYFLFFGWSAFARLTAWVWPPPPPPDDAFETIHELAERKGWKKPRNTRFDDIDTRGDK